VVAEWLLGLVSGGYRIVDVSAASSAPSSCGVVVGRKQKQARSRQVDMPAATIVLAHPKIMTCSDSPAGFALRPPLSHMGTSRRLIVGAGLKPAPTASTLGREAFA
jgi:hypothetical protein